jgi:AAA domain (dynein-related subfamily)/EVE domain
MGLKELSDPRAVEEAAAECDRLGRERFLETYGFKPSRKFAVRINGKVYDSKAIAAVAHKHQFPDLGPLTYQDLSGGEGGGQAAGKLRDLGFEIVPAGSESVAIGYWWVNQGRNFEAEHLGEFVWAGIRGRGGATLGHHTNVSLLEPGDTILHYAGGAIRAVSTVLRPAVQQPNPHATAPSEIDEAGHFVALKYFDLPHPLSRDEIPLRLRREEQGPFDREGQLKQVYLLPISEDFIATLQDLFPDRWPDDSPLMAEPRAVWLFQANPAVYDLDEALATSRLGTPNEWTVSRFGPDMKVGDIGVFWSAGKNAGIRALGRIAGEVFERAEPRFTRSDHESAIPYRYTLILDEPIAKTTLLEHLVLKDLQVIRAPRGADFKVTDDQWLALRELILESSHVSEGPEADQAVHLLFKWSVDFEPRTIDRHREVAEAEGSVWWGKFGKPGSRALSDKRLSDIRSQLEGAVTTNAYLYRAGEVWRTQLLEITPDPEEVDSQRMPGYYSKDQCVLFARLTNFEQLDATWPLQNLVLVSDPDPAKMPGALGNQTSPLLVHVLQAAEPEPVGGELTLEWLQARTLWPLSDLEELLATLSEGAQVVLAGPPGTGKTWVAKHVVRFLTQDRPLAHRVVQFHPSYGYEEFIEGLRPVLTDSGIQFDRVDGLVLEIVNQMEEGDDLYFILIDEMNRANLPRVFGELMYLLEYRGEEEAIDLQYSRDFSLPPNLRFIGTMNTADRSIRSIDTALRRRFEIIECFPDPGILSRYFETRTNQVPGLIEGFLALNDRLAVALGRHHTIGQTFFMRSPMTPDHLRRVWKRQVKPLIEEYFFDQPDQAELFVLQDLWPSLSSA